MEVAFCPLASVSMTLAYRGRRGRSRPDQPLGLAPPRSRLCSTEHLPERRERRRIICFGILGEAIRREWVIGVVKRASIVRLVNDGDAEFATLVRELGMRISSGERQRIGIARALYKSPNSSTLTRRRARWTARARPDHRGGPRSRSRQDQYDDRTPTDNSEGLRPYHRD